MVHIQEYLHIILILLVILVAAVFYNMSRPKNVTRNTGNNPDVQATFNRPPVEEFSMGGRRRRKHKK